MLKTTRTMALIELADGERRWVEIAAAENGTLLAGAFVVAIREESIEPEQGTAYPTPDSITADRIMAGTIGTAFEDATDLAATIRQALALAKVEQEDSQTMTRSRRMAIVTRGLEDALLRLLFGDRVE